MFFGLLLDRLKDEGRRLKEKIFCLVLLIIPKPKWQLTEIIGIKIA